MPILFKQLVAVLDSRTTFVCLKAAGQIQPLESPFTTLNGEFETPPFHISCRTIVAPWMDGFVNEQRALSNAELQRRPRGQRDWRKGKNPPPDDTNPPGRGRKPDPTGPPKPSPSALDRAKKVADDIERGADEASKSTVGDVFLNIARKKAGDDDRAYQAEVAKWLVKELDKIYSADVPASVRNALKGYFASTDSFSINKGLRAGKAASAKAKKMIDSSRAWNTPIDLKTYRGLWNVDMGEKSLVGGIWRDAGFQSTTLSRRRAESWATDWTRKPTNPTVMEVLIPKGTRVAVHAAEEEILLPPGTQMRIVRDTVKEINGKKVRVLTCVVEKT